MRELFRNGLNREALKESEIGPIPETWSLVNLASLGRVGSGTTPDRTRSEYWRDGSIPWITSGRMYEREINGSDERVTKFAVKDSNLPILNPGAVLIAIVGQGKTLGHCALLNVEASISRHVGYIQADEKVVDARYLRGFLESQYDRLRQLASGNGSTRAALTGALLNAVQVPLPSSLDEQREIVSILDAIEHKIDLHRRKRALLDELFNSLLHGLMTGTVRVTDIDLPPLEATSDAAA
jgi:type I restriction enzyme S subunit